MFFLRSLKSAWDYEKPPKVQTDVVDMQNISSVGAFYAGIGPFYSKHNLLIKIPLHCTEGRNPKKDDSRWGEFSLIRAVGLKGDEIACSDA